MVGRYRFGRMARRSAAMGFVVLVMLLLSGCPNVLGGNGGSSGQNDGDGGGSGNVGNSEFSMTATACEKVDVPGLGDRWQVTFTWENVPTEATNLYISQYDVAILNTTSPQEVYVTGVTSEPQDLTLTLQAMPFAIAEATDTISCPSPN